MLRRLTLKLFALWGWLNRSPRESYHVYPQTWGLKGWRRPSPALCGRLTGHEISRTETSYAGGEWCTKYCRWCNHPIQVPARESCFVDSWGWVIDTK